jgi:signal transduction histidine kinase
MATHELRTPLTIISGYVELLSASGRKRFNDEEREYVEIVQTGTRTLTMLIDDLLDLARIEAGRMHLTLRPVDVADVLERVRRMVAAQAAEKGLHLGFAVEDGLPPAAADVNRLIQILLNLVGNAIKFTERGSVTCTARLRDGGVEIQVQDSGIGISPEALDRIFDEFHQGDSGTTRRYGGTGLGLAIARRLVDMHQGHIDVKSELGSGSTFSVWLPAADDTLIADEQEQTAPFPLAATFPRP